MLHESITLLMLWGLPGSLPKPQVLSLDRKPDLTEQNIYRLRMRLISVEAELELNLILVEAALPSEPPYRRADWDVRQWKASTSLRGQAPIEIPKDQLPYLLPLRRAAFLTPGVMMGLGVSMEVAPDGTLRGGPRDALHPLGGLLAGGNLYVGLIERSEVKLTSLEPHQMSFAGRMHLTLLRTKLECDLNAVFDRSGKPLAYTLISQPNPGGQLQSVEMRLTWMRAEPLGYRPPEPPARKPAKMLGN